MIFNLLKKNEKTEKINEEANLIKMTALLIHAAKIDENYSEKEKEIIKEFTFMFIKELKKSDKNLKNDSREEILNLVKKAEEYESNSNQILEYTKEVKKMQPDKKKLVLEFLWKIVLSDDKSDVYENTLMRRICGLLYVSDQLSGEIKLNVLKGKK